MNQHRSNTLNKNKNENCLTFEILHFKLHSFQKIRIEILKHIENKEDRLSAENDYMLQYKTIYPYGLNSMLNNINMNKIVNIYDLFKNFNKLFRVKRGKRGSHKYSKIINLFVPLIWITELEEYLKNFYSVKYVKDAVFKLSNKSIGKLKNCLDKYNFTNKQFKDLLSDLINFKYVGRFNKANVIYFKMLFQQRSFDQFNFNRIFNKLSYLFPIYNCSVSVAFNYKLPISNRLFNYRQFAFSGLTVSQN